MGMMWEERWQIRGHFPAPRPGAGLEGLAGRALSRAKVEPALSQYNVLKPFMFGSLP